MPYSCASCGAELGFMSEPYMCRRTGRLAQPHQRGAARKTPKPPADPFDVSDRGQRAKRRRRRKSATRTDWLGDWPAPVTLKPVR